MTIKNTGLKYAGHSVFEVDHDYYYVSSKHRKRETAEQTRAKTDTPEALIRRLGSWYLVLIRTPTGRVRKVQRRLGTQAKR